LYRLIGKPAALGLDISRLIFFLHPTYIDDPLGLRHIIVNSLNIGSLLTKTELPTLSMAGLQLFIITVLSSLGFLFSMWCTPKVHDVSALRFIWVPWITVTSWAMLYNGQADPLTLQAITNVWCQNIGKNTGLVETKFYPKFGLKKSKNHCS
jgi:hypothetical protein